MRPLSTVSAAPTQLLSPTNTTANGMGQVGSVRSGSGFWAAGHRAGSGTSSSAFTAFSSGMSHEHEHTNSNGHDSFGMNMSMSMGGPGEFGMLMHDAIPEGEVHQLNGQNGGGMMMNGNGAAENGGDAGNGGTGARSAREESKKEEKRDELAAQDAFIAGMIYSLGQRILPGSPFTPSAASYAAAYSSTGELDRGRWRLEDCLR